MLPRGKKRCLPRSVPKVYMSISSEGYGHSSRALAIASRFPVSETLIGTYGYALERVAKAGLNTVRVSQEYKLLGTQGAFDVGKTIFENQASLLSLNQMVAEECSVMEREGVTVVVADGRIAPVIAASRLGIPCLVLTNQSDFYPFFQHDSALVKLFGKSFELWLQSWLANADEVLIPDYYPPDTVCLMNLSPSFHVKKRTRFLGPLVPWKREAITPAPRPEGAAMHVVVSLGGHAYRQPLLEAVIAMAPQFPDVAFTLLTSLPVAEMPPNVYRLGFVQECAPIFKSADCVITQAGHSTAMELLTLGVPAIVVPDRLQSEQKNNALRLEAMGVAMRLDYDDLGNGSRKLSQALHRVLHQQRFQRHAEQMALKSAGIDGPQYAAQVLNDYAHRLVAY